MFVLKSTFNKLVAEVRRPEAERLLAEYRKFGGPLPYQVSAKKPGIDRLIINGDFWYRRHWTFEKFESDVLTPLKAKWAEKEYKA